MNHDLTTATLAFGGTAASLAAYWLWMRWRGPRLEAAAARRPPARDGPGGPP
jgi:hypothetical protein